MRGIPSGSEETLLENDAEAPSETRPRYGTGRIGPNEGLAASIRLV